MKINVLHIIADINVAVAGQHVLSLHQNMDADIKALVPKGSRLEQFYKSHELPCVTYTDISAVKQAIKENVPDIVHTHTSHELRTIAGKIGKVKTVHTQHSAISLGFFAKLSSGGLSDAVIATTRETYESLVQTGTPARKIRMIYNGVAAVEKHDIEAGSKIKSQLNIPKDSFVVTCFSDITKCGIILDTAKELPYNVIVLLADVPGEQKLALLERIKNDNLQNVRILDEINNINELIGITNVQVSSRHDTTLLPLFAGMSAGKPIIATKDFDPNIIQDGVNGLVIAEFNAEELDDAITRLKENPPLYEELSAKALSRYKERFSAQRMAREVEELYQSIVGRK